ncbi:hypothetical protein AAHB54_17465, partial [Bacillus cereus]
MLLLFHSIVIIVAIPFICSFIPFVIIHSFFIPFVHLHFVFLVVVVIALLLLPCHSFCHLFIHSCLFRLFLPFVVVVLPFICLFVVVVVPFIVCLLLLVHLLFVFVVICCCYYSIAFLPIVYSIVIVAQPP